MQNADTDRVEVGAAWRRALVAVCMVVGAAVFLQGAARLPCISRDGVFFVEFAQKLAVEPLVQLRGQTKQPGYSILLLGLHSLIGQSISENAAVSWEVCGQILAVTGGIAVVGLIYLLTRRLFDARTALVAALLAAFWPQLVSVSSDVLSDAPHLALYLAGLLLGLRALEGKSRKVKKSKSQNEDDGDAGRDSRRVWAREGILAPAEKTISTDGADGRRWENENSDLRFQDGGMRWGALVACGAICGLGYWLRQEALGAAAAVAICLLWPTTGLAFSRRAARAGVVVASFVIVVAPYSIAVGKVMPNKSIKDLLWGTELTETADGADGRRWRENAEFGMHATAGELHAELEIQSSDLRFQRAGPVTWWDAPIKMLGGWSRSGRYVLSTLALVGFFWPRAARSDRGVRRLVVIAALLQIIAAQARGMQYGVVSERYLMIPAGLSIPWAAAGLVAIAKYLAERLWQGRGDLSSSDVVRRSLMVAALIVIAPMAYYDLRPAGRGAGWEREAGAWIAERASPGDVVNAALQHAAVAFYAGLERRWPVGEDATRSARDHGAWVVDDPGMSRMTESDKALLLGCRKIRDGNFPLRTWESENGGEVSVYRIDDGGMRSR